MRGLATEGKKHLPLRRCDRKRKSFAYVNLKTEWTKWRIEKNTDTSITAPVTANIDNFHSTTYSNSNIYYHTLHSNT